MVWMLSSDHGIIIHSQLKITTQWKMIKNIEECKTIYCHKTFLDYNYNQIDQKSIKHTINIACTPQFTFW